MLTCCPQLLHSFVYKVPVWGLDLLTPLGLMDLARFVCSRDLIIAEVSRISSACLSLNSMFPVPVSVCHVCLLYTSHFAWDASPALSVLCMRFC